MDRRHGGCGAAGHGRVPETHREAHLNATRRRGGKDRGGTAAVAGAGRLLRQLQGAGGLELPGDGGTGAVLREVEHRHVGLGGQRHPSPVPALGDGADGHIGVRHLLGQHPGFQDLPHRQLLLPVLHQAAQRIGPALRRKLEGSRVHIRQHLERALLPHHRLGQQPHGDADGAAVAAVQGAVQAGQNHVHITGGLLPRPGNLHDLGEGQLVFRCAQSAGGGAVEHLKLALPLENKLVSDDLGLTAPQGSAALQQLFRLRLAAGQADFIRKCKGLLLHADCGTGITLLRHLLHTSFLRSQHSAADVILHRGIDLHTESQIHPDQHLAGVDQPGVCPLYPRQGHHAAQRRQRRVLQSTGKGQFHLHPAYPLFTVREVEQRRPYRAGELHPTILEHLVPQAYHALGIADAKDIRTGIRYNALQCLLAADGCIQYGLIAAPLSPIQFQLHSVPLLVRAVALFHAFCYRTICTRWEDYARGSCAPDAENGLEYSAQRFG
ncbi:Uncharacterised protein [Flavonifractor plautii]|uniref:Uncharacterized protein n=1 Tax=Flavonifractor plautii TaxID=292800 RepID=A0A174I3Z7_FLAPL|nr:Uncharacterised protein [Flavonifractor plautii]